MSKNKGREIFKTLLKCIPFLLVVCALILAFDCCISHGRLVWAGTIFIVLGIVSAYWFYPYLMPFFLCSLSGFALILMAYKSYIFFSLVVLVVFTICVFDFILLVKLMRSSKFRTFDKSKPEKVFEWLKENEITYRLWSKLRHKCIDKSA